MGRNSWINKSEFVVGLVILLILSWSMATGATPMSFHADRLSDTKIQFDNLELTIPAGASDQEMTVEHDDETYLNQFQLPFGFRKVSKPFLFGPHGMKFGNNKFLQAKIKIDEASLPPGYSFQSVKLYYINRETKRLELVAEQQIDPGTVTLEAKLKHFSSYVIGITPGWDGNGINPFMDYIHDGETSVTVNGLKHIVLKKIVSLQGRNGFDLNLVSMIYPFTNNPFTLSNMWYLGATYYDFNNKRLYFPNGSSYDANVTSGTSIDYGDVVFQVLKYQHYPDNYIKKRHANSNRQ